MKCSALLLLPLLLATPLSLAADPPTRINYQGVLRDAAENPLDGNYSMVFRFYDASAGGVEILVDEHRKSASDPVTVSGGLFSVELGSGTVLDGGGPGVYGDLGEVFRDYSNVWLEITIDNGTPELLSPRVHVVAAGYALNSLRSQSAVDAQNASWASDSGMLGGIEPAGYLDTGSGAQAKSGNLTVADLELSGNDLTFGYGGRITNTPYRMEISAGNAASDDLRLNAGTSEANGGIVVMGGGQIDLKAGNGRTRFMRASDDFVTAEIDSEGEMLIKGNLQIGSSATDDNDTITFDGNETLTWINAQTRFELSDALAIRGPLQAGSVPNDVVAYNRFGSGTPAASGDVTTTNDLLVGGDLEVGDVAYVGRSIVVGDSSPTTNQVFSSFGLPDQLHLSWRMDTGGDVCIGQDLQINGRIVSENNSSLNLSSIANVRTIVDSDNDHSAEGAEWFHSALGSANKIAEITRVGELHIKKTLFENYHFDLAESFPADEPLEPGDLVSISGKRGAAVRKSSGNGDVAVIGVVSTSPGIVLGGAPFSSEALSEIWGSAIQQEFQSASSRLREEVLAEFPEFVREAARIDALSPENVSEGSEAKQAGQGASRAREHRKALDDHIEEQVLRQFFDERFVPVALAGRVPVKVDGTYGAIAPGDPLSPSPIPGVAMKSDGRRANIGLALESFEGGRGKVLMLVQRDAARRDTPTQTAKTIPTPTPDVSAAGRQEMEKDLQIILDRQGNQEASLSVFRDGERKGAIGAEVFRVDEDGNIFAAGALHPNAMDLAEIFALSEAVEPGDVLVADRENPGRLRRGSIAADPAVVGVVSTEPGILLGGGIQQVAAALPGLASELERARELGEREEETRIWNEMLRRFRSTHAAIAMTGTIPCKVDAGFGAIRVGDLLTVSPTPGRAMRSDEATPGTILGKALESLDSGTGTLKVLVMMR